MAGKILGWLIFLTVVGGPSAYFLTRETVVKVTATPLKRGHVEQTIAAISSGSIRAKQDAMVAPGTIGKVMAVPVKEGDRVKSGDVLVELDHAELDAQVALAEANLRVGQSRFEQAKIAATIYGEIAQTRVSQAAAQLNLAKADFDRVKTLVDRKAVSQSDFDKITMALRVSQETDSAAKAAQKETLVRQEDIRSAAAFIEQLEAAVTLAKEMRDKAYVRAPFDGVVARVFVEVGETVGSGIGGGGGGSMGTNVNAGVGAAAGAGAAAGLGGLSMAQSVGLVRLVDDSHFYIKAPFDEANMTQISIGQKARIGIDAHKGVDFPGEVTFIAPVIARNFDLSRTFDIDVSIVPNNLKIITGMSADVIIIASEKNDILCVPSDALVREEEAYIVEDGRAVRRKVKIGIGNWQNREVLDGLHDGDLLITSVGIKELKNGVRVEVVESLQDR